MTQQPNNKPVDPLNVLGGLLNDALGSVIGDAEKGKPVNPVFNSFFTKAENLVNSDIFAAPKAQASAKPEAPKASTGAAETPSAPKPDAPKHAEPVPSIDLGEVIDDVKATVTGTIHGIGNLLGIGPDSVPGFAPANPIFNHAFKGDSAPPLDIVSRENSIEYRFAVAGVKPENVAVELDAELLTVTINTPKNGRISKNEESLVDYLVQEIWSGNWSSEFELPTVNSKGQKIEIDEEAISATVKDGLVSVVVPFKERVKTKITIS